MRVTGSRSSDTVCWSTSALLDLLGIAGVKRVGIERQHRRTAVALVDGVWVNDQKPMPPAALRRCLSADLAPEGWYALLNRKVFFGWIRSSPQLPAARRRGRATSC